ncbi:hypothetical protein S7711_09116 [Stachybotrys chartarum IBT 7711]|uniref:Uncharacterized protein n=1 Tax=Stachybotrys chartarum (strain CBS 109288 / IBT 7711) TaxID=1280523 RepID=A0A084B2Y4_STACB|nr:hypothetical protein S7711_09116 [Stachybotrys chartarum IBT 7711]KFA56351.1 hypothetical protein S40293_08742 [Stachybotrys chartarum IBT 40293]
MESLHHRGSRDPTPPSPKLHPAETANQDDDDEAAQLLFQPHPRPESSTDSANLREELLCEGDSGRHDFALPPYLYTVVLLFILVLVTGFGSSLLNTPEVRLLEMALCRDFYRVHDPSVIGAPPLSYVDEERCKVDSVQVELAYVVATRSLLSAIPGTPAVLLRLTFLQAMHG